MKNFGVAVGVALTGYLLFLVAGFTGAELFAAGLLLGGLLNQPLSQMKKGRTVGDKGEVQTLFVGNIAYKASERDLRELFSKCGEVIAVRLVIDKRSGRPRGYGFVEMSANGAEKAINQLNGAELAGRALKISIANERKKGGDS